MQTNQTSRKTAPTGVWIAAGIALAFGALTIVSGGRALFGPDAARAAVGDAVPFVLWFNFLSGFVYMIAGIGIARRKLWAEWTSVGLAASILIVFALLGWHIAQGRAYEVRTLGAMVLRAGVWIAIALYLRGIASKLHQKP